MRKNLSALLVAVACCFVWGCEKSTPTTPSTPPPADANTIAPAESTEPIKSSSNSPKTSEADASQLVKVSLSVPNMT